ncbi:MAG: cupredoxin domain-containing protein [Chloroflexi bacterium]|nr:cupredoxin domain-containing protein [Chloroflexota bacterium]
MGYLVQLVVSLAVFTFLLVAPRMLTSSSGSEEVVQEQTVADTSAVVQSVRLSAIGSGLDASDAARLSPDRVVVNANEPVSLLLTNSGSLTHQLYIPGMPGVTEATRLAPGEIVWIKFTPTSPGEYTLQCAVSEHAAMHATVVVQ